MQRATEKAAVRGERSADFRFSPHRCSSGRGARTELLGYEPMCGSNTSQLRPANPLQRQACWVLLSADFGPLRRAIADRTRTAPPACAYSAKADRVAMPQVAGRSAGAGQVNGIHEVTGSIPVSSTNSSKKLEERPIR